jgi:hypothetical protein
MGSGFELRPPDSPVMCLTNLIIQSLDIEQVKLTNTTSNSTDTGSPAGGFRTRSGKSQKEDTQPMIILSTRAIINIGTWNFRAKYETGKAAQVAADMKAYHLYVLGISESRWTGSGKKKIPRTGERLLFSGHEKENALHTEGVDLMFSKTVQRALIRWQAYGSCIILSLIQNKTEKNQHEHYTMLCPNQ